MFNSNKGTAYRNNGVSTTDEHTLRSTLEFEILVLGNSDILDYMVSQTSLLTEEEKLIVSKYIPLCDVFSAQSDEEWLPEDTALGVAGLRNRVLDVICSACARHFGAEQEDTLHCLWLTDYDFVLKYYCCSTDEYISKYDITGSIKISDLGAEGALYVNTKIPFVSTLHNGKEI